MLAGVIAPPRASLDMSTRRRPDGCSSRTCLPRVSLKRSGIIRHRRNAVSASFVLLFYAFLFTCSQFFCIASTNNALPPTVECLDGKLVAIPPVEVYLLDDTASSMSNVFGMIRSQIGPMFDNVAAKFVDYRFGYGVFNDKPDGSHAPLSSVCYRHFYFGRNTTELTTRIYDEWVAVTGDEKGGQLTAMWYAAHSTEWTGLVTPNPDWRPDLEDKMLQWPADKLRVVVILTRGPFHESPEGQEFGGPPSESFSPEACHYSDFPTQEAVSATFRENGMLPVFLLFEDLAVYRELNDEMNGRIVLLDPRNVKIGEKVADAMVDMLCSHSSESLPTESISTSPPTDTPLSTNEAPTLDCSEYGVESGGVLPALDLYFLTEMSVKLEDDIPNLGVQLREAISDAQNTYPQVRVGFGMFSDKPLKEKGHPEDYCYRHGAALTTEADEMLYQFNTSLSKGFIMGYDPRKNPLEAMVAAAHNSNVEWRLENEEVVRVLIVSVQSKYRIAGEVQLPEFVWAAPSHDSAGKFGSTCTRNDYPSVLNVAEALRSNAVAPLFLATDEVHADYVDLLGQLDITASASRSVAEDSADFYAAVKGGLHEIVCKTFVPNTPQAASRAAPLASNDPLASNAPLLFNAPPSNSSLDRDSRTELPSPTTSIESSSDESNRSTSSEEATSDESDKTTSAEVSTSDESDQTTSAEVSTSDESDQTTSAEESTTGIVIAASVGGLGAVVAGTAASVVFFRSGPPAEFDLEVEEANSQNEKEGPRLWKTDSFFDA